MTELTNAESTNLRGSLHHATDCHSNLLDAFLAKKDHSQNSNTHSLKMRNGGGIPQHEDPHYLYLSNPFTEVPPSQISDRVEEHRTSNTTPSRQEWTLAIDLTTNGSHQAGDERVHTGAEHQMQEIMRLAAETRGKPVTLVVQCIVNEPSERSTGNTPASSTPESSGRQDDRSGNTIPGEREGTRMLQRYIIRNGQVELLETRPPQGFNEDLKQLLSLATHNAPSEKLGLIIQSHGAGPRGLDGDTGSLSLPQLTDTVRQSLAGTGHGKLDLLDFDACSMGNASVMEQLGDVSQHVVASSEVERSFGQNVDGQNLSAVIHNLIERPKMDGKELGNEFVRIADAGTNGDSSARDPANDGHSGTDTLAHYDLSALGEFHTALNSFGESLAASAQDPSTWAAILQALNHAPRVSAPTAEVAGRFIPQYRDLKLFAENIVAAIDHDTNHTIDRSGALRKAAAGFLAAQNKLVTTYHGEHINGYNTMGGLSAFLPEPTTTTNIDRGQIDRVFAQQELPSNTGWNAFLELLKATIEKP